MKVCILSMQKVNNFGSLLQSYVLKKILEQLGNTVEFLDIRRIEDDYRLLGNYRKKYKKESEKKGLLGKIAKVDRYAWNRLIVKRKSIRQDEVFDAFRKDTLHLDRQSSHYDLCVIGSDEVFNCMGSGAWGFTSQLFGNISEADRVITYAACCGSTRYSDVPGKVVQRIRKSFARISAFSTRDQNTHAFVSKLTDQQITDHLDPALIYDFKDEMAGAVLPKLPKHYCVVYSYYNRMHAKEEIDAIQTFCRRHKLTPVAIGAPQFWISKYVVCTPFQCLKVFENADFVITDTFHGTIFAAKYSKKFAVLTRDSNRNKLSDLIQKIGAKDHLLDNIGNLESKFTVCNDRLALQPVLEKEKNRTIAYLRENTAPKEGS